MEIPAQIAEMQKFHFGRKVICVDGEGGTLAHVVLDAVTRRLTHLGVRYGRLLGKTIDLPYDTVSQATGDEITLHLVRAELAAIHEVTVEGAVLDRQSFVARADAGDKGTLRQIAVRPANAALAYVVAHHLRPGQDTLLQEEYVTMIAPRCITVTLADSELNALPPYRPDDELQREVEQILFDLTPVHLDLKRITPRVLDSVLSLDGNVSSQLWADMVEDQVLGVPGLLEIKNRLIGDDRLAADLALILGQDPWTRELPIGIYPLLGDVRLSGAVHTNKQKIIAANNVRGFPGVRSVINDLVVDPTTDILPVMLPTGVEAEDQVPGKYIRHTK